MGTGFTLETFTFFYAVLFGMMLNSLVGLRPFPWGFAANPDDGKPPGHLRLFRRLVFSILLLNVVPFLLFWAGLQILSGAPSQPLSLTWRVALIPAVGAMGVYAPYRLYHAIAVGLRKRDLQWIYSTEEFDEIKNARKIRMRGHLLATTFYMTLFAFLFLARA